jgi:hypothetical protein
MDVLVVATNIYPSQSAITTATCVRVAAISIAAYECVFLPVSLLPIASHVWPAISLPSLWNFGSTSLLIDSGKKGDACLSRKVLENAFNSSSLALFVLIRYVSRRRRLSRLLISSVGIQA